MRRWRCAWLSWVALNTSPSQHSTSSRKTGTSQLPGQLSQQVLSSCLGSLIRRYLAAARAAYASGTKHLQKQLPPNNRYIACSWLDSFCKFQPWGGQLTKQVYISCESSLYYRKIESARARAVFSKKLSIFYQFSLTFALHGTNTALVAARLHCGY